MIATDRGGAITAVASVDGISGAPMRAPYGAAKAALMHLIKSLAVEWADYGIRVNSVAAGSIITPRLPETDATRAVMRESLVPLRRSGEPQEIAAPLLFLCSDMARYITGHSIAADGGWSVANIFNLARNPNSGRVKL
jgi:NAD(P)-dependent dehydrogenase (short-subunit alcohol dehydrogenase family)